MQLYHHPLSMNSQKVRIALEEKNLSYTVHRVNPLKARNFKPEFFRQNPGGALPVLKNGSLVICESLPILEYIDTINDPFRLHQCETVREWVRRINEWDAKLLTLSNVPERVWHFFSRFKRHVLIANMTKNPDLATLYHTKLRSMHAIEENLKSIEELAANKQQLKCLLDDAEEQLSTTQFIAGFTFSVADAAFMAVLGRIELLKVSAEYLQPRPQVSLYWKRMKERPSYKRVIGKYSARVMHLKFVIPSICNVGIRKLFMRF
ncbi:unnamed protein product [Sphagnum balticum]